MHTATRTNIEQQCSRLVSSFAYLVDHREYASLVELFSPEGRFERPDRIVIGRAAILAFMRARPETHATRHFCASPYFVEVSPERAVAVTYLTLYQSENPDDVIGTLKLPVALVEYHDTFVFDGSGWKIDARVVKPVMAGKSP